VNARHTVRNVGILLLSVAAVAAAKGCVEAGESGGMVRGRRVGAEVVPEPAGAEAVPLETGGGRIGWANRSKSTCLRLGEGGARRSDLQITPCLLCYIRSPADAVRRWSHPMIQI
jgi:hypothetical protein